MGDVIDFAAYRARKEAKVAPVADLPIVWEQWAAEPVAVNAAETVAAPKINIRAKAFDFDSDAMIPAEKPHKDYSELKADIIEWAIALGIAYHGIKTMILFSNAFLGHGYHPLVKWFLRWCRELFWPIMFY